jgi:phage tail sheath protein FI
MELGFEYWIAPGPPSYFRVSAQLGGASSPWSNTVSSTPEPLSAWTAIPPESPAGPAPVSGGPILVAVHTVMLQIAAARGDMVAILSLPVSFRTQDAAAYPAQLGAAIASAEPGRTLSYGALYHPWLVVRDSTAPLPLSLRTVPPDGGVCGLIAKTTLSSGAWIAAANVALQNVLDLQPAMTPDAWTVFDQNQVNLISQQPEGFLVMGQDTLVTVETDLVPLNVRRLLILIRRLALREGVRYVFRNMTSTFVRQVTRQWDGWMQQMLARGAFAGLSAADSYRIIADGSVNTPVSIAQSQFIVELQVAPSVPMRFLTVQLVQSGGQLTLSES